MRKLLAIKLGKSVTDNKVKFSKPNNTQNIILSKARKEFKRKVVLENLQLAS